MTALDHLLEMILHVVAQVVEAELVVGAVGHVAGVLGAAFVVGEAMNDAADSEAEKFIYAAHPLRVAPCEIVVHCDDVNALAGYGVEVDREGRHEGLALTRLHLGDAALMEHHAADKLNVEMTLLQSALGRLADRGKSRHEQVVERGAFGELPTKLRGAGLKLGIGELLDFPLDLVYRRAPGLILLDLAIVGRAKNLGGDRV